MMRSESTRALGQPRLTKPIFGGVAGIGETLAVVDGMFLPRRWIDLHFRMVHSFKPVWKPPFISTLAPEDRCPVNGLAMKEGVPRYATAASCCDVVDGWRERRYEGGILIDVQTDRIVTEDLSMPHSPRLNARVLWVLDSGRGYLCRVEEKSGKTERVAFCPGFARKPSFWRRHALSP